MNKTHEMSGGMKLAKIEVEIPEEIFQQLKSIAFLLEKQVEQIILREIQSLVAFHIENLKSYSIL